MTINETISEARLEKSQVISLITKLYENNPHDHYWRELLDLSRNDDFFEPCMLQYWIGKKYRPRKILEIGTRTGGSLISLLYSYSSFEQTKIYAFDLWKENLQATFLNKIPVIRVLIKKLPLNNILALRIVKKNLRLFSIPVNIIRFISGDSKKMVPAFFEENPELKFDYILVDGAHDAETAYTDLENVADHLAPNGFLVFDDISPLSYNLLPVWEKFKRNHTGEFDFFESMHRKGIGWAKKN